MTITERMQLLTPMVRLMSEDPLPLEVRTVQRPATPSPSRPDIVVHLPHLEIPVDPKPNPRP